MKKNLCKRFFTCLIILFGFFQVGFSQVAGDYRSAATGSWNVPANWETYDGSAWAVAFVKPVIINSVYIQSGHTMTLTENEACNDLHFCNNITSSTSGTVRGKLDVTAFILEVNGKLRNYWGAIGEIPGTTFATVSNQPYSSSGGRIKFVGNTRNLTNTGEWGAMVNSPNSSDCDIEIALNPGQTGTFQTNIKAGNWTFTSGTVNILTVAADKSATLANITIGPDAIVIASSNSNTFQKSGSGLAGALTVDGKLIFTSVTPKIQVTSIAFNGTVQYDLAGDQTLATAGSGAGAALPNTYNKLILSNSGVKTLGLNTIVNNSLTITGTASLNLGAFTLTDKSANDIKSFSIPSQLSSLIDAANHTVTVKMPFGTSLSALTPAVEVSSGASVSPLTGVEQNFTSPVNYTVTAENLTTQLWTVTVTAPASLETGTDILTFNINLPAVNGTVNVVNHTVSFTVPYGTNVSALVPAITLSAGAAISPLSGVAANFTSTINYTVTAQNGTTKQDWTVSAVIAPNTQKEILSFSFAGLDPVVNATINPTSFTITAGVPSGTDLTMLAATFALPPQAAVAIGATPQVSGVTVNDFSTPKVYTVTAGDGTTQAWTVNVSIAGEPLVYDGFDYTPGELLSAQIPQGWATYSTAGATEVIVSSGNLSYPGLFQSQGNKISFDGGGTDINKSFTSQSAVGTKVYYSFILQIDSMKNVTSNAGSHFAGLSQATSTVGASAYFKWDGIPGSNKFAIGTAVRGATASVPVYTAANFDINTPILIVGCYEIVDGLLNDKSYIWINPSADDFGLNLPPAPTLNAEGGLATDLISLGYFYIRQDATTLTPYINIDELRIGLNWADVTPKAGVVTFSPGNDETDAEIATLPAITFIKPIRKIGGTPISNSDLAGLLTFRKNNASGALVPFTATIDANKQVITITPSSVLDFSTTYYIAVGSVEDNTGASISGKNSKFITRAPRINALLTDLKVGGKSVTGFDGGTLSYNISLEYGTTTVPAVSYELSDINASAILNNASAVPGTSSIVVTAENGTTTQTYLINFSAAATPSKDATLSDMKLGGVTVAGFVPSIYEYLVALPFGTVLPPAVTVKTNSSVASAVVTQAQSMTDITFVEVTAQDGTTTLTYAILFELDPYVYKIGFTKTGTGNNEVPFAGWTTDNTIVSSNWGALPIVNHGEFTGPEAFRFITGKSASVPPSSPGWLKTSKYSKSGILNFWLYVQATDGKEELLIHKKVNDADSVLVARLNSAEMSSANWKEFTFDINEKESTAIIFTSVLTMDGATRIWLDDLSLKGDITTGISKTTAHSPLVSLYPNPVQDQLLIDMNYAKYKVMNIYNSLGSIVLSHSIIESSFEMDVRNLKAGLYFIQFKGENILYNAKFIKL